MAVGHFLGAAGWAGPALKSLWAWSIRWASSIRVPACIPQGELELLEQRLLLTTAPLAVDDTAATNENTPVAIDVLANDRPGNPTAPLSVQSATNGRYGTVMIASGLVTYSPMADFHGTDSFTYVAWDGAQASNVATVTVTVAHVAQPPTAGEVTYTMPQGAVLQPASVEQGVLSHDYDADGHPLTARLVAGSSAAHGTLSFNGDGTFCYTPAAGFAGEDSFQYLVNDTQADSNVAAVTINVRPAGQEHAPAAQDMTFDINCGQNLQVDFANGLVQSNSDPDGDLLRASLSGTAPQKAAVNISPDGSFSVMPAGLSEQDFSADDVATLSFQYQLSDGLLSGVGAVTVCVHREGPTASDQAYSVVHDRPLAVTADLGLLSGSTPGSATSAQVVNLSACAAGGRVVSFNPQTGAFTYQPAAGFVGRDSFSYCLANGVKTCAPATVSIDVTNQPPIGLESTYRFDRQSSGDALTIASADQGLLASVTDGDGDALKVVAVSPCASGAVVTFAPDGTFTYRGVAGGTGSDTFKYRVSDGVAVSDWIPVTIVITHDGPVAQDDSYELAHDRTLTIDQPGQGLLANDQNVSAGSTIQIFTYPSFGTLHLLDSAAGTFTYTPNPSFVGQDLFSYCVVDDFGASNLASVMLQVNNSAPVAGDLAFSVNEDGVLSAPAGALMAGATDADGDSLSASLTGAAGHGNIAVNADGSFQYTPQAYFNGTDTFTYALSDGLLQAQASVTVTVNPVNHAPTVAASSYSVHAGELLKVLAPGVLLNASDVDGDSLSAVLVSGPTHGTLILQPDGSFTYQPAGGAVGIQDAFTFRVSDGQASTTATATIAITNTPPVAANMTYYVVPGTSLNMAAAAGLTAESFDADGDSLTEISSTPSLARQHGGADSLRADGSFTYTPGSFTGTDIITYTISDGWTTSQGTLTLIVGARPIIAYPDSYSVLHDRTLTVPAIQGVLNNDWSTSNLSLTAQRIADPAGGTLALGSDGSFTFSPPAGAVGTFSFTYEAVDTQGHASDPVMVTINVTDNLPVAQDDSYRLLHDQGLAITPDRGVMVNDYDLDSDTLTAQLVQPAQHGLVTLAADGSFGYVPAAHYVGADSFTYQLSDGAGLSAPATVNLEVDNTAPVAARHDFSVRHDRTLSGSLSAGCYDVDRDNLTYRLTATAAHGSVTVQSSGAYTYIPAAGYVGQDSFCYVVNDGVADSVAAIVNLSITNSPPRVCPDDYHLPHGQVLTGNLLTNVSDADGDTLSVQVYNTHNVHGDGVALVWQSDGSFSLTPPASFVGVLSFAYSVFDGAQWSAPAPVNVEYTDTPPVGLPDYATTPHDHPVTLNVLANDYDSDSGDTVSLAWWTAPSAGSVSRQAMVRCCTCRRPGLWARRRSIITSPPARPALDPFRSLSM